MGVEAGEECIAQGHPQAHKESRQGVRERIGSEQDGCGRKAVKGKRGILGKKHIMFVMVSLAFPFLLTLLTSLSHD
jgi:hypothetical protein